MIRRRPPSPAQLRRRVLGGATVVVVTIAVLLWPAIKAGPAPRPRPIGGVRPARGAGAAHRAKAKLPPKDAQIVRVFHAEGGTVTAVVTEKGSPACEVDLLGPSGTVLARGWASSQPLSLRAVAVANDPLSLVLRPTGGTSLSWQANLTGVSG